MGSSNKVKIWRDVSPNFLFYKIMGPPATDYRNVRLGIQTDEKGDKNFIAVGFTKLRKMIEIRKVESYDLIGESLRLGS